MYDDNNWCIKIVQVKYQQSTTYETIYVIFNQVEEFILYARAYFGQNNMLVSKDGEMYM